MTQGPVDDDKLKQVFKAAIIEVLEERRDLLREVLEEALEDIALVHAIDEGQRTGTVTPGEVFSILDGDQ